MQDKIIARLPFDSNNSWYEFVQVYKSLPLKETSHGRYKEIRGHSYLIHAGVTISSTITETEEVGRVSMRRADADLISNETKIALAGWGWKPLFQGADTFVFLKSIALVNLESTMPMALPLILQTLGVEPLQDWKA